MAVKGILFNTEMVRAILDGRKTVTRRVMKPANPFRNRGEYRQGNGLWIDGYSKNEKPNGHIKDYSVSSCWIDKKIYIDKYAPYKLGDILYVRETWNMNGDCEECDEECDGCTSSPKYRYKAAYKDDKSIFPWHPSIHMPKEAARIWLKVIDVRMKQLQDMNVSEAISEGIDIKLLCRHPHAVFEEFAKIWDSTIKKPELDKYGWEADPWVWVIDFKRCEKPESEVK